MRLLTYAECKTKPDINDGNVLPGIDDVERKLKNVVEDSEGIVGNMCVDLLCSGGKRLRPRLVIISGLCFSKLSSDMIDSAVAAEFIHMASLVHDDIIDKSDSRRGYKTLNSAYGNHAAVLAGDYLFAKAFSILSSRRLVKSMHYLVNAISEMCDGEINQMTDQFNSNVTIDDYFSRIAKKTAVLVSSCCCAGAASAGAPDDYIEVMNEYGMNIGYAFQIVDDILDFTGDSKITGKPSGSDIVNGNITLPVILLLNDENYGMKIRELINLKQITAESYLYIKELLIKTGAVEKAYDMAYKCVKYANTSIHPIPDSLYKEQFYSISNSILNRMS